MSTDKQLTVYIQLLNEGTVVYRPALGVKLNESTVRLMEPTDFDPDEEWEFPVGSTVVVTKKHIDNSEVLVATALADISS